MADRAANHLAGETSPYLRQHAHNPVDWHPWGEAAFARARAEQKPIFVSIGYSTCHWCHVMAHESFEDEAIAELLNRDFVPVKVDREERPDVDRVYMAFVQAATGQGGWPMSVWLTPELKPFFGGTYFPPDERWGRPGFAAILGAIARAWAGERGRLQAEGDRVAGALQALAGETGAGAGDRGGVDGGILSADVATAARRAIAQCYRQLLESFDPEHGGFGGPPKFPRAAAFLFLHRMSALGGPASDVGAAAEQMAAFTLRKMAEGGIHDHVGGGFHRYSVDAEWFVPHFEKMLYDQAQLACCYLEAYQAGGDDYFAGVARDILDYVRRDLVAPQGGFHSAEDADSEIPEGLPRQPDGVAGKGRHAEGAFYLWSKAELDGLLGADAGLFGGHFGVEADGNVDAARDPHGEFRGKNLLRQRRSLAESAREAGLDLPQAAGRVQAGLARLREARARRPRPARDDKILAAWNGLMISALARGRQVLGDPGCGDAAVRAAEFLQREMYDAASGIIYRSHCEGRGRQPGFAEDYACVVQGLLDLYEAVFDGRWLQWAEKLQTRMDELFWDEAAGGYFSSSADDPTILVRLKEDYDGAEPAPGSVAAMNLLRLGWMLDKAPGAADGRRDRPGHLERAARCLAAYRRRWEATPQALPLMLSAFELALQPPRTVVLAGDPRADDFRALVAVVHERRRPRRVLLARRGEPDWVVVRVPSLADMTPVAGHATAYLCENLTCQQPVTEPGEFRRLLEAGDRLVPEGFPLEKDAGA